MKVPLGPLNNKDKMFLNFFSPFSHLFNVINSRYFSTYSTTSVLNIRISLLYICNDLSAHHPALTLSKSTWLTVLRNFIRRIPSFHARFSDNLAPTHKSLCTVFTPCTKTNGLVERQGILVEYTMTITGFNRIADFFPNGHFAGLTHHQFLDYLKLTKADLPYGGELEFVSLVAYLRGTRKVFERMDLREAYNITSEANAHYPVMPGSVTKPNSSNDSGGVRQFSNLALRSYKASFDTIF